jgi:hypothetical protein
MRLRAQLLLIVLVFGCGLQTAAAASLTATAGRLGAGTAAVGTCDGNGFTFRHVVDTAGRIGTVTTTGLHASCAGGTLRLTLVNGTASVGSGSAALPSSGFTGSVDVAISPQPLSTGVTAVYAVVEGP